MAEENKGCSLAVHLAMTTLLGNEDMMKRLIEMSNQMNTDYLFHDLLKEWVDLWVEWDASKAAREYSLKWQSAEMKFKATLFSWVLANTSQWDEALQAMFDAIKETGWSIAEWLDLLWLAAKMDLSEFENVSKALWMSVEEARAFSEEARTKISNYIASEYSVVSTGTTVKPSKMKPKIEKQIAKATEYLDKQKEELWDAFNDVNKDLKRLQSKPKSAVNYWSKKEWRDELKKLQEKYNTKSASKRDIEAKLSRIKGAEDTIKDWNKKLKEIDDEYKKALEEDLKVIKDWQNPYNYVWPDAEWKFNKEFNNNISNRVLEYGQYVLARTLLTSDSILPQSVYTSLTKLVKDYAWKWISDTSWAKISEDWILDPDRTLDELLAAAYINTKQLCNDWQLRMTYRQRLISLASDWAVSMDDVNFVNTMMETLRFSWEWAGFSDILKYSVLKDWAKDLLWADNVSMTWKELWDNIVKILWDSEFNTRIRSWDTVTLDDWTKITTRQLLELVTMMVWDTSLYKLIASNNFTDKQLLDVAWAYLVWNAEEWRQAIINLVDVVRKNPTTDDTRWIVLKALTGKQVPADTPVAFFDFRRHLPTANDVKERAKFRDKLADANKIYIPDTGIQDITTTNESELVNSLERYRWWFVLVTDSQFSLNKTLTSALDKVNYEWWKLVDEKRRVVPIFATAWLMWKVWMEKGKLVFKTSYSSVYDAFLRKISMRTLSDAWVSSKLSKETVDTIRYWWSTAEQNVDALMKFNKELEADAKAYFGAMIWKDPLDDRLPDILEQMTWISFKNYDAIMNKAEFWRMADERFMLWLKTMGKYDQEVVTIADVIKQVDSMTPAEIASELSSKYWFEIPEYRIADWNGKVRKEVRDAYLNYNLAETHIELLERKWKLLAVINGWVADNITINQFKSMWQSKDFSAYKDIFFHDLDLADEELNKHIKAINDMVFEWLCLQFADNLVAMGYSLPLVNVRDLVYDYLNWKLNVNWDFARAFLYKNGLPDTLSTLNGIVNEAMPNELRFGYDDAVKSFDNIKDVDQITRMVEVQNPFMADTYSTLLAMAVVKDWLLMENAWAERQVLQWILNDYYNAVKQATEWWKTLSFSEAQKLKTKAWYALDMFEQNYISPRYKQFLTPEEKNELFWLKYTLWVATNTDSLETIAEYNNKILDRYDNSIKRIIDDNNDLKPLIKPNNSSLKEQAEKRNKELIQKWATLRAVWWDVVVVDTREELLNQIRNMPDNVGWLDVLKSLWRAWIDQLSNEQAYFLLQLVQLARNADNKMNMVTWTIYKLYPQLAKIDFFNTYKVVNWLPKALWNNLLEWTDFLSQFTNTSTFDNHVKRDVFERIKNAFAENWRLWYYKKKLWKNVYVSEYDHLQEIIDDAIEVNIKDLSNTIKWWDLRRFKDETTYVYTQAFSPYTVLKDIPTATKIKIDEALTAQQKWITDAMELLWDNNRLVDVLDWIYVTTNVWEVKTLRNILEWDEVNLSRLMFDTDTNIVKSADELAAWKIDPTLSDKDMAALEAENKKLVEAQENNYNDALAAYLNNSEIVSQSERELLHRLRGSARQVAKQYTLTNKLADTDNALAWINEEIIKWFKADILWFKWNVTAWWQLFWTQNITDWVMARWWKVQESYRNLYSMSYDQLVRYTPKWEIDEVAWNMAKYFKEIERRCWSLDWLTWATTSQDVNRAFAHVWEIVMNINSIHALFSLMSWIEWNQILKFFRFSEPWQLSRVNELVIWDVWDYWVWWYRNYVDRTDEWLNREWFNKTFWANLTNDEYQKLVQALCWFTVVNKKMKWLMNTLNLINSSNYLTRALLSYPWQFITIGNQAIAYFLKQKWRERELWAEDLWTIDNIRKSVGILTWPYNELNIWEYLKKVFRRINPDSTDPNAFYNRYWLPDVDGLMAGEKFYTSDDISSLYSKIDNYGSNDKLISWSKFMRNTDAYKDNANNIIDWLFARNYKNIAFVKALQSNRYMTFATAEQFAAFLASDAPWEMKQKLLDAVTAETWKNFRNILWLWFAWLDRATWWWWLRNIFVSLWQMWNFRWAWWQNMARQTSNRIITAIKMSRKWLSKEWRDMIAEYIAKQPEFINFTSQLFNDLHNMRRLTKYQDNWDYLPEWDEYSLMDFLEYSYETMQFASQRRQWIQSYWATRILTSWVEWAAQTYKDPELYKDTLWIWALMNAISKNLWRNWKVMDMFAKWLAVLQSNWWRWDVVKEFLSNEFWKLSFWSLRYLMNEDETNYWYSTELINSWAWGIPFIITWETDVNGDKAYSYDMAWTETWLNLVNWREAKKAWDTAAAREYVLNNIDSFYNSSQMFNFVRNIWRAVAGSDWVWDKIKDWLSDGILIWWRIYPMWSPFDLAEAWEVMRETDAGNKYMTYWYYVPTDIKDIEILVKEVMWQAKHRPGNDWFNKSMFNFDASDHMKNLEESNAADASMELLLSNIKYLRDDDFKFVLDDKWNKIVNPEWTLHMNDMYLRFNDENYMTNSNFNFINSWIERNNKDPNYMLYKRLIAEWVAWRYVNQQIQKEINWYNKTYWLKWDYRVTKTKLEDSNQDYSEIYARLPSVVSTITWKESSFLQSIIEMDKAAASQATIKMIERQLAKLWDTKTVQKFFKFDDDWNVNLSSRYESYIEEQAKLSQMLRDEDLEWFIAETSSITKMFEKEDPYGLATTTLISSRIHRINQADNLTPEQKAKAINALMVDNYEFIQQHVPEFIDELWENAAVYIDQMNNSIYDISLIWDLLTRQNEANNSKSWRSSSVKISWMAKNLLASLGKSTGTWNWVWGWKSYNYNIVPVKLDWAKLIKATWGKWYTPKTATAAFESYTPHVDFSVAKDINRQVKWPTTQQISNKKQLSKLESSATKALEAES